MGEKGLDLPEPATEVRPTPTRREGPPILRIALLFYGGLGAVALLWNGLAGTPVAFLDSEAAIRGVWWSRDLFAGFATAALVVATSEIVTRRTEWGDDLARALGEVLGPLSWRECLVLAAASGLAEEAFFRGVLQPRVGYVGASLLFGLAHFAPQPGLRPWTGFAIAAGFVLGGLYAWTENLVAPVVAHFGINAINLRLLARRYGDPGRS